MKTDGYGEQPGEKEDLKSKGERETKDTERAGN